MVQTEKHIKVKCTECNSLLSVPQERASENIICPSCSSNIQIPQKVQSRAIPALVSAFFAICMAGIFAHIIYLFFDFPFWDILLIPYHGVVLAAAVFLFHIIFSLWKRVLHGDISYRLLAIIFLVPLLLTIVFVAGFLHLLTTIFRIPEFHMYTVVLYLVVYLVTFFFYFFFLVLIRLYFELKIFFGSKHPLTLKGFIKMLPEQLSRMDIFLLNK